jgi:hypothetical protein
VTDVTVVFRPANEDTGPRLYEVSPYEVDKKEQAEEREHRRRRRGRKPEDERPSKKVS